jgi:hypothetical protein
MKEAGYRAFRNVRLFADLRVGERAVFLVVERVS